MACTPYTTLQGAGDELKGLCLSHDDHAPSLSVNPKKGFYHCPVCCVGGDVFRFVEKQENISYWKAVQYLGDKAGIYPPRMTSETQAQITAQCSREEILGAAADFYYSSLNDHTRSMIKQERNFDDAVIDKFRLGRASGGLKDHLRKKRFTEEACLLAGVLKERKGKVVDHWWNHLIIPNFVAGRCVHITGRVLDESKPKYLHVKGPKTHLFNEDALLTDSPIVCEGPMDAMALEQAGFPSVALMGLSIKDGFVERFKHCKRVFIAVDGDEAGQKHYLKLADLFKDRSGIVGLPPGEDPCSFLKSHSPAEFQALLDAAKDPVAYRLEQIPPKTSGNELVDLLNDTFNLLSHLSEPKIEAYLKIIAVRFELLPSTVAAYKKDIEKRAKKRTAKQEAGFCALSIARKIASEKPIICHCGRIYLYEKGVYQSTYEEEIDQATIRIVGKPERTHTALLDSVRRFLRTEAFQRPEDVNPSGWLNLSNCLLNLEEDEKKEHTPNFLSTIQAATAFDLKATWTQWQQFLDRILPEKDKQALLGEIFGYCLTSSIDYHAAFVFLGAGANGKGVVFSVLENLIGKENCSTLMMDDLKSGINRFRIAGLVDKLVNFTHEIDAKSLFSDGMFKKLVAGDPVMAERKNQSPFDFRPRCKFLLSANEMPATRDHSYGLHRRLKFLTFDVTIPEKERDPHLSGDLIRDEASGILNWSIAGYRRLKSQKGFTVPVTSKEAAQRYRTDSDHKRAFIEECTVKVAVGGVYLKVLYPVYERFCKNSGFKSEAKPSFNRGVQNICGIKSEHREGGEYLSGIALAPGAADGNW